MQKVKCIIISCLIIFIITLSTTISNSQSIEPIFSIQSVVPRQISKVEIQNFFTNTNLSGNLVYLLIINATFVFPQDTPFSGVLNLGCGISVDILNTTFWQVINFSYNCPHLVSGRIMTAGTYNSTLNVYINSIKNYTDSSFPNEIDIYIHSTLNNPEYESNNYYINLPKNTSSTNQTLISNNFNGSIGYIISFAIIGVIFLPSTILVLVQYRKYRKEKIFNTNLDSFLSYLQDKVTKDKKPTHQELHDATLHKLEDIIDENSNI